MELGGGSGEGQEAVEYFVREGIPISSHNELVALVSKEKTLVDEFGENSIISLGDVERKYVVTPDLSNL